MPRKYTKEYYNKNKERISNSYRNYMFKKHYGITLNDYNSMLLSQNGLCALCGSPPKVRKLSVDHNHKTKQIRALLCSSCNMGLGYFKENPVLLDLAKDYLKRFNN